MDRFTMRAPDDFHVHFRSGDMMRAVVPHTARQFTRALVMPNTNPPVLDEEEMAAYEEDIRAFLAFKNLSLEPLMTIQIVEDMDPARIAKAKRRGAVAGKVYPRNMTTNSANGVADYRKLWPVFAEMEEYGMLGLFHGEHPDPATFCLDREARFLDILQSIAEDFPGLRIVIEHVTTAAAVDCVACLGNNVAATITVHHLYLTLNDVIGGSLAPHHFCKPVAKRHEDLLALIGAATGGNPKFFLGTDSAPHLREAKECASGCAGVFTAPVAIPLLLQLFEYNGHVNKLENFCSGFGADFYGLERNEGAVTLVKDPWVVPPLYDGVVPFWAGKEIVWRME